MAIQVTWENDKKEVLLNIYESTWTMDDFYLAVQQTNAHLASVNHKVNLIFDLAQSPNFPKGFMSALRSLSQKPHANSGIMVIVGINAFGHVFYDMFTKVYTGQAVRQPTYMAANYEEAHAIFARHAEPG
jgi:hypothetical protein